MSDKPVMTPNDITAAVKAATENILSAYKMKPALQEAYVAQPKQFGQVSDFVGQRTKDLHSKLYQGYVQDMNQVSAKLDASDKQAAGSNSNDFRSLKHDEARLVNAVWLHELFFANCFDPNSDLTMDTKAYIRLQRDWGTFDDWQREFVGSCLAAGEGWAICGYNIFLKRYVNTIVDGHADSMMLGLIPILAIDMWSHAYVRDYAIDKQSYIVAMMKQINWGVVEERLERAEKIAAVYK